MTDVSPEALALVPAPPIRLRRAMVLAAGRGTRLGGLTLGTPKPLLEVGARALIDRALDALAAVGIEEAVVNTHHLAETVEHHLASRTSPAIRISREETLLETGGGVCAALPLLGVDPFVVLNADLVWSRLEVSLGRLAAAWRDAAMDALLLLHPTVRLRDYAGRGDFMLDAAGRATRRPEAHTVPFVFTGAQILHPRVFEGTPEGPFSLNLVYDRAEAAGRLFGLVHDGDWSDVGTPESLRRARAEAADARQGRFL